MPQMQRHIFKHTLPSRMPSYAQYQTNFITNTTSHYFSSSIELATNINTPLEAHKTVYPYKIPP